jgi:hypothetical protein
MRSVALTFFTTLMLLLTACEQPRKLSPDDLPPSTPRNIVAEDKSCKILLPSGWITRKIDDTKVLRTWVPPEGPTFVAYRTAKVDLDEEVTYLEEAKNYLDLSSKAATIEKWKLLKGPTKCVINGRNAVQYLAEATEKEGRMKNRYWITVVDGQKSIFYLAATYRPSAEEKYRSEMEAITNSFMELP